MPHASAKSAVVHLSWPNIRIAGEARVEAIQVVAPEIAEFLPCRSGGAKVWRSAAGLGMHGLSQINLFVTRREEH